MGHVQTYVKLCFLLVLTRTSSPRDGDSVDNVEKNMPRLEVVSPETMRGDERSPPPTIGLIIELFDQFTFQYNLAEQLSSSYDSHIDGRCVEKGIRFVPNSLPVIWFFKSFSLRTRFAISSSRCLTPA